MVVSLVSFVIFDTSRDHNREMVLQHIRYAHYQGVGGSSNTNSLTISSTNFTSGGQVVATDGPSLPPPLPTSIPSAIPAFRCGVCNQVSNWKHVIQVPFDNWIETYFFDGRLNISNQIFLKN